jgi:hypothetical protein
VWCAAWGANMPAACAVPGTAGLMPLLPPPLVMDWGPSLGLVSGDPCACTVSGSLPLPCVSRDPTSRYAADCSVTAREPSADGNDRVWLPPAPALTPFPPLPPPLSLPLPLPLPLMCALPPSRLSDTLAPSLDGPQGSAGTC